MRATVYRNLDRPFQILGLNPGELIAICLTLVGGSELASMFSINRIWIFFFLAVLILSMIWIRRSLGAYFWRHLLRFLALPGETKPKIIMLKEGRHV